MFALRLNAVVLLGFAVALCGCAVRPARMIQTTSVTMPSLREELLAMGKADQEVRVIFTQKKIEDFTPEEIAKLNGGDAERQHRLKEIIHQYGWPTRKMVGQDGVDAAFLIVQHADSDHAFQKSMLPLVQAAFVHHEIRGEEFAMLTDRVLVGDGKPQRYGTQVDLTDGKLTPFPIEDEAHVDKRRAKMGMMPMADYLQLLRSFYKH